ncbi:MAG: hypothetical protein JXA50_04335 [Deltaproteobacteria bacterium]|nr:hypothetical protein [Deltaproteobacteria bacterium]
MKEIFKLISLFSILIIISSCTYEEMAEKFIPKEESEFAKEYISKLRNKELEYVKSMMSPEILSQVNDELLLKMANYFRDGELISTKIVGSQVKVINGQWSGNFTFEYEFETGWNLANAALRKVGGGYEVIGLNVYQTEASQKELNAFSFSSKSALHYLVFLLAIIVPLFIFTTIFICVRTPIPRRKWLWIIFILFGVGAIAINWTTGQYAIQLLSVNLFGAAAIRTSPYAPWIFKASFPLGAIIFCFKRRHYIALADQANKANQPTKKASRLISNVRCRGKRGNTH